MGNVLNAKYIRQPKYYKDFHCLGGMCPVTCCYGWRIDLEKEEVEKLKNADCSKEMKDMINSAFIPYQGHMIVKFDERKKCPFQNEEGWCLIHRELGEEYLSFVCRSYPRQAYYQGCSILRGCCISCNYVLTMICSDENSMDLENIYSEKKIEIENVMYDSLKDIEKNRTIFYREELFDFFYRIISDRTRSIETSIVLGAMAAQKLDEFINKGKYDRIQEIIKALEPQLNNPAQIQKLEKVKPNLSLKANFSAGLLKQLNNASIYTNVFENGIPSEEKYHRGIEEFRKCFNGTPGFMRNIALNLYITNKMPFRDKSRSLFENYCYFVSEVAVIKFLIPAVSIQFAPADEQVKQAVAYIDRSFTHNDHNVKKVLDYMKAFKCTTPAYLLGIIK